MPSKFRYYLIDDYFNVTGTSSIEVAKAAFFEGSTLVINVHENFSFEEIDGDSDELAFMDIPEHNAPVPEAP
jgi:hypothetical protein